MNKQLIKLAFFLALGEVAYITLVVSIMNNFEHMGGENKSPLLAGITILLMLVFSASISGALVLGKPILLYLDGKKREAVQLFGAIIGWLLAFLVSVLIFLLSR